jgi:hypothetical protein
VMGEGAIEEVSNPLMCCVMDTVTAEADENGDEDRVGSEEAAKG